METCRDGTLVQALARMNGEERIGGFVFVVCGAREHIDTLHFSLHALKRFTVHPVTVVTDSRRNEIPVEYDSIIDVPTPEQLDHHQASIWLKTSLHRILPEGLLYCYLDTDVVALSSEADRIFEQFVPPVTFAPDHCTLDQFSPRAVKCGCLEEHLQDMTAFNDAVRYAEEKRPDYMAHLSHIERVVADSKRNPVVYLLHRLRYTFGGPNYSPGAGYQLLKATGRWSDSEGNDLQMLYGTPETVERLTDFRWNETLGTYLRADGRPLFDLTCTHLHRHVEKQLGVNVTKEDWQHWNGGVFLFKGGESSILKDWHEATVSIFGLTPWNTRDQGTLAAMVWKHGLNDHPVLDRRFNFIVNTEGQEYLGGLGFNLGNGHPVFPVMLHIYHRFGDSQWQLWNDVSEHVNAEP